MGVWKLLCIAVLLAGCAITGQVTHDETISIGGVFHLSGAGAFWGISDHNGALMAIEEINAEGGIGGQKLEMVVEDSGTDFTQTTLSLTKLASQGVPVIIGPTWFGQVAGAIASEQKTVIVSPSAGTISEPSPYLFVLWPTARQEALAIATHMKQRGVRRVAIVYTLNDYTVELKNQFATEAKKNNITIIKEFATENDQKDFRTIITRLEELKADAVFAPFAWYPSQGEFSVQYKSADLSIPLYTSAGAENPSLVQTYGTAVEKTFYAYPRRDEKELLFAKKYTERFGEEPGPSAAYAYDAVHIVAIALAKGTEPEQIREHLASIENYEGVSNTITFDSNGRVQAKEFIIKQIRNGTFVLAN